MIETMMRQDDELLLSAMFSSKKNEENGDKQMKEKKKRFKDDAPCDLPVWYKRPTKYTEEGCMLIAAALINSTNEDYVRALKTIMACRKLKVYTPAQLNSFTKALATKKECEEFYLNGMYELMSMNLGWSGKEKIAQLKLEAHYID